MIKNFIMFRLYIELTIIKLVRSFFSVYYNLLLNMKPTRYSPCYKKSDQFFNLNVLSVGLGYGLIIFLVLGFKSTN